MGRLVPAASISVRTDFLTVSEDLKSLPLRDPSHYSMHPT
jgi:hypothetical protein